MRLADDTYKLTTIQKDNLLKVFDTMERVICDYALESYLNNMNDLTVDIGFGELTIYFEDGKAKYKFVPSGHFENLLVKTLTEQKSPVEERLGDILTDKLLSAYKDMF